MRKQLPRRRWCPGAGSNHRHCDFQSHALPTELPGRRPERCPGRAPVYSEARLPCPATGGFSRPQIRQTETPQNPPDSRTSALSEQSCRPISARPHHPRRHTRAPEWHKTPTATDSDRRPGNVPSKTAWKPRPTACRRSGRVSPHAQISRRQLAFNQPKRTGKPSPPISAVVS